MGERERMSGECPYYKREAEHGHEFYPTGEKRAYIPEIILDGKKHWITSEVIDYKWMCECGAMKWIKEEECEEKE